MSDHKRCAGCLRICEVSLEPLTDGLCPSCVRAGITLVIPGKFDPTKKEN